MKRAGHLFEKVADFQALCAAARHAARGKGETHAAASFLFHLETEVLQLQREILDGSYRPRPYRTFTVSDPKPRTISAADFRDRVAHHALCAALEPLFERTAIFDSYACRPGKGSHAAARRAQAFAGRFWYFLLLFSDAKESLRDAQRRIRDFVERDLKLELKGEASLLAPVSEGVPFLGLRLWPRVARLDGAAKRRLIGALRLQARGLAGGRLSEDDIADSMRSRLGHAASADTLSLRRSWGELMDFGSEALRAPTG